MILHMEVDTTRQLLSAFKQSLTKVQEQAQQAVSRTNGVVGTSWIAEGATEFQNEMSNWNSQLRQLCSDWETLNNRLNAEIAEWEQVAAKLAG